MPYATHFTNQIDELYDHGDDDSTIYRLPFARTKKQIQDTRKKKRQLKIKEAKNQV